VLYIHVGPDTEAGINFHRTVPSKVCAPCSLKQEDRGNLL
jgi:hypothetical protein